MPTIELATLQAELASLRLIDVGGFTLVTIEASFNVAPGDDDAVAGGTVTFTLCQPVANADVIVPCTPLVVSLDDTGSLSAVLVATDDFGTVPQGVWYGVTEQITGAQPRDYFVFVSQANGTTQQLASLIPGETAWL